MSSANRHLGRSSVRRIQPGKESERPKRRLGGPYRGRRRRRHGRGPWSQTIRLRGGQAAKRDTPQTAKSPGNCIVYATFSWSEAELSCFQHCESRQYSEIVSLVPRQVESRLQTKQENSPPALDPGQIAIPGSRGFMYCVLIAELMACGCVGHHATLTASGAESSRQLKKRPLPHSLSRAFVPTAAPPLEYAESLEVAL